MLGQERAAPQLHCHQAGPRDVPRERLRRAGSLTCRRLHLLPLLCEGDLEPFLGRIGRQDHAVEDGLGGRPVAAWWHLVHLGKEVGSSQDVLQVGVLWEQSAQAARVVHKPTWPKDAHFAPRWRWRCLSSSSCSRAHVGCPQQCSGQLGDVDRPSPGPGSPGQAVAGGARLQSGIHCTPGTGSALPLPALSPAALPCTHIVGVECQRMGTAPVPCPEGDTRAGFLPQGEQSQARGHRPPQLQRGDQQRGEDAGGASPMGAGLTCSGGKVCSNWVMASW